MAAKLAVGFLCVIVLIPVLIAAALQGALSALVGSSTPSATALSDIPADYLALYRAAAGVCPGLDWSVLAAIGKVETDHGRSPLPGVHSGQNSARAGGPMQILQGMFDGVVARHPFSAGGASPPSRYNPHDAVHAAAFILCENGAGQGDLRSAIFAYNHADWYVDEVLAQAKKYNVTSSNASVACPTFQSTFQSSGEHFSSRALVAVRFACAQLGKPYVWGGNGDRGFDCSGLTKAAYDAAGIDLPRTAQTQYDAGPRLPTSASLLPGDLLFFGTPNDIHHVGISVGGVLIVNAPTFGQPVQVEDYRRFGDYAGASSPAEAVAG